MKRTMRFYLQQGLQMRLGKVALKETQDIMLNFAKICMENCNREKMYVFVRYSFRSGEQILNTKTASPRYLMSGIGLVKGKDLDWCLEEMFTLQVCNPDTDILMYYGVLEEHYVEAYLEVWQRDAGSTMEKKEDTGQQFLSATGTG